MATSAPPPQRTSVVRSLQTQRALLVVLAGCLAVSGVAFVSTAVGQFAWQERDAIDFEATGTQFVEGDEATVRVTVAVSNPTPAAVTVQPSTLVVYDGDPGAGEKLTVPRSARAPGGDRTVPPGETVTVTVVADVQPDRIDRTKQAIASGRSVVSGTFQVDLRSRSYYADV